MLQTLLGMLDERIQTEKVHLLSFPLTCDKEKKNRKGIRRGKKIQASWKMTNLK